MRYMHVVKKTDNVPSQLLTICQSPMGTHSLGHMMYIMCPSAPVTMDLLSDW